MTRAKLGSLSLAGLSILCLVCLQHLAEITHSNFPASAILNCSAGLSLETSYLSVHSNSVEVSCGGPQNYIR